MAALVQDLKDTVGKIKLGMHICPILTSFCQKRHCIFVSSESVTGGDEKARKRHTSKGKMLPRDRISCLLDPG